MRALPRGTTRATYDRRAYAPFAHGLLITNRIGSHGSDAVFDSEPRKKLEKLARFLERAEAELTGRVRARDDVAARRQLQFEETEQRSVAHAADHEAVVLAVNPEGPLGDFDR